MNKSKTFPARIKKYWRILGPGLITGASDDDSYGIAIYSQAGADFVISNYAYLQLQKSNGKVYS